jgi:catechol 2,3-dioxygenase-like lactoylglutathione lyase family enzyme
LAHGHSVRKSHSCSGIFSVEKAREFYLGFLGFAVDWEHRFEPTAPLYMQVSRGEFLLHLSEHYGDGCPGAVIFLRMTGLEEFHRELTAKGYRYMRPGIEQRDWGRELTVTDPFGNRIRFSEPAAP